MANSLGSLQGVLHRTSAYAEEQVKQGKPYGPKLLELRLIQSKEDIEKPPQTFKAIRLTWGKTTAVILVHKWCSDDGENTEEDQ